MWGVHLVRGGDCGAQEEGRFRAAQASCKDLETGRASFCQGRAGDKIIRLEIIDNESIASALKQSVLKQSDGLASISPRPDQTVSRAAIARAVLESESRGQGPRVLRCSNHSTLARGLFPAGRAITKPACLLFARTQRRGSRDGVAVHARAQARREQATNC